MLTVKTASGATAQGRIEAEHLADHPAAVRELQEAVSVGARLGPLLVLEKLEVLLLHASIPQFLLVIRTTAEPTDISDGLLWSWRPTVPFDAVVCSSAHHCTHSSAMWTDAIVDWSEGMSCCCRSLAW